MRGKQLNKWYIAGNNWLTIMIVAYFRALPQVIAVSPLGFL